MTKVNPTVFDRNQVADVLRKFAPSMGRHLLDGKYYCLTQAQWDGIIHEVGLDPNKYVPERYDCDSFSRYFWAEINHRYEVNGLMTVVDFSGGHSYNALLVVSPDGKSLSVSLYEPQNGSSPVKGSEHYEMKGGFFI